MGAGRFGNKSWRSDEDYRRGRVLQDKLFERLVDCLFGAAAGQDYQIVGWLKFLLETPSKVWLGVDLDSKLSSVYFSLGDQLVDKEAALPEGLQSLRRIFRVPGFSLYLGVTPTGYSVRLKGLSGRA